MGIFLFVEFSLSSREDTHPIVGLYGGDIAGSPTSKRGAPARFVCSLYKRERVRIGKMGASGDERRGTRQNGRL